MATELYKINVQISGQQDVAKLEKELEKVGVSIGTLTELQKELNQQLKNVEEGSESYKALQTAISKVDAQLSTLSDSAKQANTSVVNISASFGSANFAAIDAAENIAALGEAMTGVGEAASVSIGKIGTFVSALNGVRGAFQEIGQSPAFVKAFEGINASLDRAAGSNNRLKSGLAGLGKFAVGLGPLGAAIGALGVAFALGGRTLGRLAQGFTDFIGLTRKGDRDLQALEKRIESITAQYEALFDAAEKFRAVQLLSTNNIDADLARQFDDLNAKKRALVAEEGNILSREAGKISKELLDNFDGLLAAQPKLKKELQGFSELQIDQVANATLLGKTWKDVQISIGLTEQDFNKIQGSIKSAAKESQGFLAYIKELNGLSVELAQNEKEREDREIEANRLRLEGLEQRRVYELGLLEEVSLIEGNNFEKRMQYLKEITNLRIAQLNKDLELAREDANARIRIANEIAEEERKLLTETAALRKELIKAQAEEELRINRNTNLSVGRAAGIVTSEGNAFKILETVLKQNVALQKQELFNQKLQEKSLKNTADILAKQEQLKKVNQDILDIQKKLNEIQGKTKDVVPLIDVEALKGISNSSANLLTKFAEGATAGNTAIDKLFKAIEVGGGKLPLVQQLADAIAAIPEGATNFAKVDKTKFLPILSAFKELTGIDYAAQINAGKSYTESVGVIYNTILAATTKYNNKAAELNKDAVVDTESTYTSLIAALEALQKKQQELQAAIVAAGLEGAVADQYQQELDKLEEYDIKLTEVIALAKQETELNIRTNEAAAALEVLELQLEALQSQYIKPLENRIFDSVGNIVNDDVRAFDKILQGNTMRYRMWRDSINAQKKAILDFYKEQIALSKETTAKESEVIQQQLDNLEIERERLVFERTKLQKALQEAVATGNTEQVGVIQTTLDDIANKIDVINAKEITLSVDKEAVEKAGKDAVQSLEVEADRQKNALEDEAKAKVLEQIQGFIAIGQAVGQSIQTIIDIGFEAARKRLEGELEFIQEAISGLDDELNRNEERLDTINEQLDEAEGARRDQLLKQRETEIALNEALLRQQKALRAEEAKKQKQIEENTRKQAAATAKFALLQEALAIAGGVAQAALTPFPANLAAIAATIAAVTTAFAKVKEISSLQKFAEGGLVEGKSHREGGVKIEAEGGEFIVRKEQTKKFLPVLKNINEGKFEIPQPDNSGLINAIAELGAKMASIQPVVSVVDINKVQNRLNNITKVTDKL